MEAAGRCGDAPCTDMCELLLWAQANSSITANPASALNKCVSSISPHRHERPLLHISAQCSVTALAQHPRFSWLFCVHAARVHGGVFRRSRRPLIGLLARPIAERATQRLGCSVGSPGSHTACQTLVSAPPTYVCLLNMQRCEQTREPILDQRL